MCSLLFYSLFFFWWDVRLLDSFFTKLFSFFAYPKALRGELYKKKAQCKSRGGVWAGLAKKKKSLQKIKKECPNSFEIPIRSSTHPQPSTKFGFTDEAFFWHHFNTFIGCPPRYSRSVHQGTREICISVLLYLEQRETRENHSLHRTDQFHCIKGTKQF